MGIMEIERNNAVKKSVYLEYDLPPNFDLNRKELIDFACRNIQINSFADLGAVYAVDGAYTFYTMERYKIKKAFLVDTDLTELVLEKAKSYERLTIINSNFGNNNVLKQIGNVDAVILFDVLLHQVKPDWDKILEMYASFTNCFIIYNPQFIASDKSLRLLDLGEEEYFRNIPHDKNTPTYKATFEKMYEMHPKHKRIWRDIHNIWQWGIVDEDLFKKMKELKFSLQFYKNYNRWGNLKNFENHGFIFKKSRSSR